MTNASALQQPITITQQSEYVSIALDTPLLYLTVGESTLRVDTKASDQGAVIVMVSPMQSKAGDSVALKQRNVQWFGQQTFPGSSFGAGVEVRHFQVLLQGAELFIANQSFGAPVQVGLTAPIIEDKESVKSPSIVRRLFSFRASASAA